MNNTAQATFYVMTKEAADAYTADREPDLNTVMILWGLYSMLRTVPDPERKRALYEGLTRNLPRRVQQSLVRELKKVDEPGAVFLTEVLRAQRKLRVVS